MKTFDFPPAPPGHYFQIKHNILADSSYPRWRVVLVKKVLGFIPVEVVGAEFKSLDAGSVWAAADRAREGFFARRALKDANKVRKNTNRAQKRAAK